LIAYNLKIYNFDAKGYRHIDIIDAFDNIAINYEVKDLFGFGGHYSAIGNKLMAIHIHAYLNKNGLIHPGRIIEN